MSDVGVSHLAGSLFREVPPSLMGNVHPGGDSHLPIQPRADGSILSGYPTLPLAHTFRNSPYYHPEVGEIYREDVPAPGRASSGAHTGFYGRRGPTHMQGEAAGEKNRGLGTVGTLLLVVGGFYLVKGLLM